MTIIQNDIMDVKPMDEGTEGQLTIMRKDKNPLLNSSTKNRSRKW